MSLWSGIKSLATRARNGLSRGWQNLRSRLSNNAAAVKEYSFTNRIGNRQSLRNVNNDKKLLTINQRDFGQERKFAKGLDIEDVDTEFGSMKDRTRLSNRQLSDLESVNNPTVTGSDSMIASNQSLDDLTLEGESLNREFVEAHNNAVEKDFQRQLSYDFEDETVRQANAKKSGKVVVKAAPVEMAEKEVVVDGSFNVRTGKTTPVIKTVKEPIQLGPETEGFQVSSISPTSQKPQWRTRRYGNKKQISGASQAELNAAREEMEATASNATAEPIIASNNNKTGGTGSDPGGESTNPNHSSWKGTALWVAGGMAGGALLHKALSNNRGQQSNAQLYGQQPLY